MTAVRRDRHALPLAKYPVWKMLLDRTLAAVLLLPALPLIGLLSLLIRMTSSGAGIYRQVRIGRNGRAFTIYKLRSMVHDAEPPGSAGVWCVENDPRVTPLGRWLRDTHLDELPQLFNVIKGDMSLVGPRPERPDFVVTLVKRVPGYAGRFEVPPGVTGLAQINLPPDTDLESVCRKIYLDKKYIRTISLKNDLLMMLCTAAKLFGCDGDWAAKKFGLLEQVPRYPKYANQTIKPDSLAQVKVASRQEAGEADRENRSGWRSKNKTGNQVTAAKASTGELSSAGIGSIQKAESVDFVKSQPHK